MVFSSLGLADELLQTVAALGYDTPTPVQAEAIPAVLAGRDVLVSAQTGTGKTAAFTLPLLQRLMSSTKKAADGKAPNGRSNGRQRRFVRALILTPTRELASQISKSVTAYSRLLPLRCGEVYGGVAIRPQIDNLRRGLDILVATPGRLQDHLDRGTLTLDHVEVIVLDEADRMLDMGFLPAIEAVLDALPSNRQSLLFSATYSPPIKALASQLLREPAMIEIDAQQRTADSVDQCAYRVDEHRKAALLQHLLEEREWGRALVFTRTKRSADQIAEALREVGVNAESIHGDKKQRERQRVLMALRRSQVSVLVATDVAARGIDIQQLPVVINYELPQQPEDYIHRIGRTGRGGERGEAITLISRDEWGKFQGLKRQLKVDIDLETVEGFEPAPMRSSPRRSNGDTRPSRHKGRMAHHRSHPGGANENSHRPRRARHPQRNSGKEIKPTGSFS